MHVLVKFFCLAIMAFVLSHAKLNQFITLVMLVNGIAFWVCANGLIRTLRRVKWLLVVLVSLYAFSSPGEYLLLFNLPIRPTYEGLHAGLTQMLVIITMLASLTLVLSTTPRAKLIGGLYQILSPLQYWGIDAQQFTVRLWLTLHYVESSQPPRRIKTLHLNAALNQQLKENAYSSQPILIDIVPLKRNDYVLMALVLLSTIVWVL